MGALWEEQKRGRRAYLAGNSVWLSDFVAPIAPSDGHNGELGEDDGPTNGGGDFLAALHTQPNVPVVITNGHESLKTCPLSGTRLLLHGHNFEHFIPERGPQEEVNDLKLLNWEGIQVDFLQCADLSITHKASQLRYGNPFLLILLSTSPATSTSSATTTSTTATSATS
uniref:Uncharacterized protein n=1 Tax=Lutzomyia longipalpis TaxID=7200 RepID=A0A1B0GHW0_LUTLO